MGVNAGRLARLDPYREGCPPEVLQRQAEQYARLFQIFRNNRRRCAGFVLESHDGRVGKMIFLETGQPPVVIRS